MKTLAIALAFAFAALASPAQAAPDFSADETVRLANERVDLAEHALAQARRNTWSTRDGVTLQPTRRTLADIQRVEFYRRDVTWARNTLVGLVQQRQREDAMLAAVADPQPQQQRIKISTLEWVPYVPPR
jgi:hypothetical protein